MSRGKKKRPEAVSGGYVAIPWRVMDSPAYQGLTVASKALLLELARQHSGSNNGRLHLVHSWLARRGWPSKSIVDKCRDELLARGLIVQTRQGGLSIGPTWYALTWHAISSYAGLDIAQHQYAPGSWALCSLPPTARRNPPSKKICRPDHRGSIDPTTGAGSKTIDPTTGAIKPILRKSADPTTGDNAFNHSPVVRTPPRPKVFPAMRAAGWRFVGAAPSNRRGATCFQVTSWKSEAEKPSINPEGV